QLVVDLPRGLRHQEGSATEQDQVLPREGLPEQGEQRCRQAHHPGDGQEQCETGEQGQAEAGGPGRLPLRRGELPHQDRDEDDVVDPQHDLHQGERGQAEPCLPRGEQLHHRALLPRACSQRTPSSPASRPRLTDSPTINPITPPTKRGRSVPSPEGTPTWAAGTAAANAKATMGPVSSAFPRWTPRSASRWNTIAARAIPAASTMFPPAAVS